MGRHGPWLAIAMIVFAAGCGGGGTTPIEPNPYVSIQTQNIHFTGSLSWPTYFNSGFFQSETSTIGSGNVTDPQGGARNYVLTFVAVLPSSASIAKAPSNAAICFIWSAQEWYPDHQILIGSSASSNNTPLYFDASGALINHVSPRSNTVRFPEKGSASAFWVNLDFSQATVTDTYGFFPTSMDGLFTTSPEAYIPVNFRSGN